VTTQEFLDDLREIFPQEELTVAGKIVTLRVSWETLLLDNCAMRLDALELLAIRSLENVIQSFASGTDFVDCSMMLRFILQKHENESP